MELVVVGYLVSLVVGLVGEDIIRYPLATNFSRGRKFCGGIVSYPDL